MARRRPTYSAEFKAEALRRVRSSDASLMSIAKELGMSNTTLKAWVEASRPTPEIPLTDDERSELKRLRKQVRDSRDTKRDAVSRPGAFVLDDDHIGHHIVAPELAILPGTVAGVRAHDF